MPVKDRIIGGGFLMVGVAIVLILVFVLNWGGLDPKQAYEQIRDDIFPDYLAAERDGDYLAMRDVARRLVDVMNRGGASGVRGYAQGAATAGRETARLLNTMLEEGAFEKNSEGLFGFEGGWFRDVTHRSLQELRRAVDEDLKKMRLVRETAAAARKAVEEARTGSGLALELPPAADLGREDVPIVEPNPVYRSDGEAFRVFGLPAADLEKALATPDPKGRATSARLRWNQTVVPSRLSVELAAVGDLPDALRSLASTVQSSAQIVGKDEAAADALRALLQRGAQALGVGLDDPYKSEFRANMDPFIDAANLAQALRRLAALVETYRPALRTLAPVFGKPFA